MLTRRQALLGGVACLPLAGCTGQQLAATINSIAARIKTIAAAIDAAVVRGVSAIAAAAPTISADIQAVCNVAICLNNLAQSAVSLSLLDMSKNTVKTCVVNLNAFATSQAVQAEANGTLTGQNPLALATSCLQLAASLKGANSKLTATAAVASTTAAAT